MAYQLDINAEDFRRQMERRKRIFLDEIRSAASDTAAIWENEIQDRYSGGTGRATLARRTGHLGRSVRSDFKVTKDGRAIPRVFIPRSGPFYSEVHEHGPITIRPKRAKALRFQLYAGSSGTAKGAWRSAKAVTIPQRPVWAVTFRVTKDRVLKRWDLFAERAVS